MEVATSAALGRCLEAIYCMADEGEQIRPSRLARWLNLTRPTVTVTLQRLRAMGLVRAETRDTIALTAAGTGQAMRIVRRHRIIECWLVDVIGFDWIRADEEADRLQHAFSDDLVDCLHASIGLPASCPHGNPIPGESANPTGQPLSALAIGTRARVVRISEVAEHEAPALLRYLALEGIRPGKQLRLIGHHQGSGSLDLDLGDHAASLSDSLGWKVWVEVTDQD